MKVGIIGYGWVGKAMFKLFPDALVYDPALKYKTTKEEINQCDIVFICVPTPCIEEGKLDTSIVEESVNWCLSPTLVIRSTVNVGFCDYLRTLHRDRHYQDIVYQPEYLGETPSHPMLDMKTRPFMIIGGYAEHPKKLIDLYFTVYNANVSIRLVTLEEAEIIKLTENRAILFKVSQCQELYDVCELTGVDYYIVRDAVYGDDPRFNLWFTAVYPDKRGANSKCIPKDVYAWCAWAESLGYDPKITRTMLGRNKEWIK